jgi:hypothetical protein
LVEGVIVTRVAADSGIQRGDTELFVGVPFGNA